MMNHTYQIDNAHIQSNIQSWQPLKPNDVVDIIAPAAKCHPGVLTGVKNLLESWQLKCNIPTDLFGEDLLFANSDEKRFEQLKEALCNSTSKAVWCLLGGYGSAKLIPQLCKLTPPSQSKIFMGFSDITALHIFLQEKWGWSTIHAPSARQAGINKVATTSMDILKSMIFAEKKSLVYDAITPLNALAKTARQIHAPIIGGNLHLIQASLGTQWQMSANDKIIFIEEINERAYRIDRILEHLKQAGVLSQAKAILFGDLLGGDEADGSNLIAATIHQFAERAPIPVLQIANVGHGPINNPIILGATTTLTLGETSSLTFHSTF
ncbi:MAG: LD-carboxypeptidase [Gammaproteobacteria bacterium]|nr:LD-carboxypeptidase [Gammaproteobacteria bacterium]